MDSARIERALALGQGSKAEGTVWFDGTKLPAVLAARVNAAASDAAAFDDSDIRTIAHFGRGRPPRYARVAARTGALSSPLRRPRICTARRYGSA